MFPFGVTNNYDNFNNANNCKRKQLGLQYVMDRRKREAQYEIYHEASLEDSKARYVQLFCSNSDCHFVREELKRRAKIRQGQYLQQLGNRRAKLSMLFKTEDDIFKNEITNSIETPMQHRQRLQERLKIIQEKNRREHEEEVARKLEAKWREECDPLRKEISARFVQRIAEERKQQIAEQEDRRFDEEYRDHEFAKIVRRDAQLEEERRRREEMERRDRMLQNRITWTAQMKEHDDRIQREKMEEAEEGRRFREQNDNDIIQARLDAEEKARQQFMRRAELDEINQDQTRRKMQAREQEAEIDRQILRNAKESLRAEQEDQLVDRVTRKLKQEEERRIIENQLNKKKAADDEADWWIRRAQAEHEFKVDEARRIDAEKRRNLHMDARAYQVWQMEQREKQKELKKQEIINDRKQIEEDLYEANLRRNEEIEQQRLRIQTQAAILRRQTAEKNELERRRKQEEWQEAQDTVRRWREEDERIKRTLQDPNLLPNGRWRGFK